MMAPKAMADEGTVLDAHAAAERIGIAAATVRWHALRGALVGSKQGRLWAFEPAEVERFRRLERRPGRYEGPRGPNRRPKQLALPLGEERGKSERPRQPPLLLTS
jgi:hypothetical protein